MTPKSTAHHPVLDALLSASEGRFPPVDGRVEFVPPCRPDLSAVVSFTGHALVATSRDHDEFAAVPLDGFGQALHPSFLHALAGPSGRIGAVDAVLVARGSGGGRLPERADLEDHPRVQHARALRDDVRVHGDHRGLVTLSRGLAGRTELSVEVVPHRQGHRTGPSLIRDALALVTTGDVVFAAVSPGNARSLRAFLDVGFQPLGSEVLIQTPTHRR